MCHLNSTESIQSLSHFGTLNLSYIISDNYHAISVHLCPTRYSFSSQVKHLRVKCLAQGHNIETMSQHWEGRNMIFPASIGIRNCTAVIDIDKAPRSNHCAMSLSVSITSIPNWWAWCSNMWKITIRTFNHHLIVVLLLGKRDQLEVRVSGSLKRYKNPRPADVKLYRP